MSDSGKSSKFDVSSILLISIEMAAGRSLCIETESVNIKFECSTETKVLRFSNLMCSQSTDSKN